jgi:hypothetical protein
MGFVVLDGPAPQKCEIVHRCRNRRYRLTVTAYSARSAPLARTTEDDRRAAKGERMARRTRPAPSPREQMRSGGAAKPAAFSGHEDRARSRGDGGDVDDRGRGSGSQGVHRVPDWRAARRARAPRVRGCAGAGGREARSRAARLPRAACAEVDVAHGKRRAAHVAGSTRAAQQPIDLRPPRALDCSQ